VPKNQSENLKAEHFKPEKQRQLVQTPKQTLRNCSHQLFSASPAHFESLYVYLYALLENLEGVEQSPRYHPEGDALYHSLQVFQCALAESDNPILWAAALFHDVGKAIDYPNHANTGADALDGLLHPRICWLIRHHLDLLIHPKRTRSRLRGQESLQQLEILRKWDLQGRRTDAEVMEVHQALDNLLPYFSIVCANNH